MTDNVWTVDISSSLFSPPLAVAGDLVVMVRSPRSANSVTVVINPNVADFQAKVDTPPGLEIVNLIALTPTGDTVTGLIMVGEAGSKHFLTGGREYRITLQAISNTAHRFFVQEGSPGDSQARHENRKMLLQQHREAVDTKNNQAIVQTADALDDAIALELSPSSSDMYVLAVVLYNKGVSLRTLNRYDEERAVYSRIIEQLDMRDEPLQEHIAKALFARAFSYGVQKQYDLAIRDYAEIDRRYGRWPGAGPMRMVVASLMNMAQAFGFSGRQDDMKRTLTQLIERYGTRPEVADQVTQARRMLG